MSGLSCTHTWEHAGPDEPSDRIVGLLGVTFADVQEPAVETGLLGEASVELDKHLSMHPALRANRATGGQPCSLKVVDPVDYQLYDWNDWSKLVPDRDEPFVQAVRQRFRVPEVVTLTEFDRLPSAAVTFSRRNVFKRDRFTCQYCGKQPGGDELTIDHVVPRAQSGESNWTNCVLACLECNKRKADRTPAQAEVRLRKEPIRPTWKPLYSEHASRMESWSKFISEAYWNAELRS